MAATALAYNDREQRFAGGKRSAVSSSPTSDLTWQLRYPLVKPPGNASSVQSFRLETRQPGSELSTAHHADLWLSRVMRHIATPRHLAIAATSKEGAASFLDVIKFCAALPTDVPLPKVSMSAEGETSLVWVGHGKKAIADFEGDGAYGYALLISGTFQPGDHLVESADQVPDDLLAYIRQMI